MAVHQANAIRRTLLKAALLGATGTAMGATVS
jgi:hypothetical protein